jgi:hypothetical protein
VAPLATAELKQLTAEDKLLLTFNTLRAGQRIKIFEIGWSFLHKFIQK